MDIVIDQKVLEETKGILDLVVNDIGRARKESLRKSEFSQRNFKKKRDAAKKGEVVRIGTIPKHLTYVPISATSGKYILNDHASLIHEMIDGVLSGKSLYMVADGFNQRGIKPFRYAKQWTGKNIRQILRNPVLKGDYLGNANYVPPIVDKETFERIQNQLDRNKTNRGNRGKVINIFKGLCLCSACRRFDGL